MAPVAHRTERGALVCPTFFPDGRRIHYVRDGKILNLDMFVSLGASFDLARQMIRPIKIILPDIYSGIEGAHHVFDFKMMTVDGEEILCLEVSCGGGAMSPLYWPETGKAETDQWYLASVAYSDKMQELKKEHPDFGKLVILDLGRVASLLCSGQTARD